jgi:hypothetical protein
MKASNMNGTIYHFRAWNGGNLDYLPKIKLKRFCSSEIAALERTDDVTNADDV